MNLKIKRLHPDAVLPSYAKDGDSGLDLHAVEDVVLLAGVPTLVRTGIAVELPGPESGKMMLMIPDVCTNINWADVLFEAQIRPRSGLALKHGITVVNAPGTVDNGYRGEIGVILRWDGHAPNATQITKWNGEVKDVIDATPGSTLVLNPGENHRYVYRIRKGDRIAQMVVAPVVRCNVVEAELSESERGSGGFGSTGK